MKRKIVFFLGFFLVFGGFIYWQHSLLRSLFLALRGRQEIVSPLSYSPSKGRTLGEITTIETDFDFGSVQPEAAILAQGAYIYDLSWRKVIFEKDAHRQLPAASTIKIVTAAVALDKGKLSEDITVNWFPTVVGEGSMNLGFGEKFSLEELLYGLLMASGNDAAETIAQGLAGKREIFVEWMNQWAKKVGAKNTNFTTPSGLDEEGQYTTAYDLFLLSKEVFIHYPKILEISTTKEKYLPKTAGHKAYLLRNKFLLLDDFPILAAKPGLGEGKILSLVALLQKNSRKILVVLIRTPSLRHDLDKVLKLI